jgi:pSer/pThr/pTyr-binding forkhead associated (FHA) protein
MAKCIYCHHEISASGSKCEICGTELGEGEAIQQPRLQTVTESRSSILGSSIMDKTPNNRQTQPQTVPENEVVPFQPLRRPPAAVLCILDDGCSETGELIRIRADQFVIGRSQGDVQISNDDRISSPHAELSQRFDNGKYHWHLKDLDSRNGTFVKISSAALKSEDELLIGHRVYRFNTSAHQKEESNELNGDSNEDFTRTRGVQDFSPEYFKTPSGELIEVRSQDDGQCFELSADENWVGSNSANCTHVIDDDPAVSMRHAKFFRNQFGVWHVEDADTLNGLWMRIQEKRVDIDTEFQLGQQRFLLKVT